MVVVVAVEAGPVERLLGDLRAALVGAVRQVVAAVAAVAAEVALQSAVIVFPAIVVDRNDAVNTIDSACGVHVARVRRQKVVTSFVLIIRRLMASQLQDARVDHVTNALLANSLPSRA